MNLKNDMNLNVEMEEMTMDQLCEVSAGQGDQSGTGPHTGAGRHGGWEAASDRVGRWRWYRRAALRLKVRLRLIQRRALSGTLPVIAGSGCETHQ